MAAQNARTNERGKKRPISRCGEITHRMNWVWLSVWERQTKIEDEEKYKTTFPIPVLIRYTFRTRYVACRLAAVNEWGRRKNNKPTELMFAQKLKSYTYRRVSLLVDSNKIIPNNRHGAESVTILFDYAQQLWNCIESRVQRRRRRCTFIHIAYKIAAVCGNLSLDRRHFNMEMETKIYNTKTRENWNMRNWKMNIPKMRYKSRLMSDDDETCTAIGALRRQCRHFCHFKNDSKSIENIDTNYSNGTAFRSMFTENPTGSKVRFDRLNSINIEKLIISFDFAWLIACQIKLNVIRVTCGNSWALDEFDWRALCVSCAGAVTHCD